MNMPVRLHARMIHNLNKWIQTSAVVSDDNCECASGMGSRC
jgi:hypothetical protein